MTYHRVILALAAACLLAACGAQPAGPAATSAPASTAAGASAAPTGAPAPTAPASDNAPTSAPAPTAGASDSPASAPEPTAGANDAPTSAPAARATFTPAVPTAPAGPAADQPVDLKLITNDLKQPVFATHPGDDSGRLFVVEKGGTIAIVRDGQRAPKPFLDVTSLVTSRGSEQGLLGLAFHPDYRNNGRFFIYYTAQNGDNTLARYQVSSDADVADPNSGVVMFAVPDPAANHNGGMLAFGPDKYLYVGLGDGGRAGDPWGNGQNRNALLGKLLRLDVDKGDPYGIPADNPWPSASDARPEVWAYGLRNPWRFSFDRATGDLYIGDVGQNQYEEIDFQPAGTAGGRNYGWNTREGLHCYQAQDCATAELIEPVAEYSHEQGCSVTGGYVYRGAAVPQLQGRYVYGDYCSGLIWTLSQAAPGQWEQRDLLKSSRSISSFAEDQAGELYLTDIGDNGLYQFVSAS